GNDRDRFQDLLPGMMLCLTEALNGGNEATAQEALELLIELAGTEPRFLRRQLVEVVGSMLQIAEAGSLEEGTRHLAIEFVITLAEARERAPGMMRKLPQFISRLFAILMRMLLDIEDEAAWHSAENEDEDAGESSNYSVGQECLDRLAIALGGNTIVPVASEQLPAYLAAPEWQKHLAALVALAQIAEGCSKLVEVVGSMLQIAEAGSLEEGTRHLAIEFVITLAEARERAPGMMRKLPQFISRLFAILMRMLLDIEDEAAWHSAENEDEDAGESSNYSVGQECLDRLAIALGGNTIVPVASEQLPAYLAAPEWQKHLAALVMIKNLEQVVSMVLNSFQDPHPRVRWAAINAIGQLSTDLGPDLQVNYHARVLPALASAMDDFQNPRVQAHAASANGKQMVQEGALTALASVADSSQEQFQKYYDAVMPYLKAILINANDKANRMLRAKAMECISLVGMAVGKDKFRDDAKQVMEVLMSLQGAQMETDDPTTSYMLQAWARLCKCLGQDFLPYMAVVMPPLLQSDAELLGPNNQYLPKIVSIFAETNINPLLLLVAKALNNLTPKMMHGSIALWSTRVEPYLSTPNPVRIIPGPAGIIQLSSSTRVEPSPSTPNPVRIISGPAGIIQQAKLLKERDSQCRHKNICIKLLRMWMMMMILRVGRGLAPLIESCSLNGYGALTVTMKDLLGTILGTLHYKVNRDGGYGKDITVRAAMIHANVSLFSPKPSMHYLNITRKNVVRVFHKDTVFESGNG
nr:importin-5-like [Tanacetum cinerariifolium]